MTDTALEIRRFTVRGCYELCEKLVADPNARPDAFWINTSSNDLVKRFVDKADKTTRDEIEQLIAGEAIEKISGLI